MIEVKIPGTRHGMGYIAGAYYKGSFVTRDGVFTSGEITALPANQKNKPGFAYEGALKLTQVTTAAAGQRGTVFPINKLLFAPEGADADSDLIPAGSSVIYYQGGQYETDQFLAVSGTAGGDFGDNLEVTVSGKLTESLDTNAGTQFVAKVIKMTFGDDYTDPEKGYMHAKDTLWYELVY